MPPRRYFKVRWGRGLPPSFHRKAKSAFVRETRKDCALRKCQLLEKKCGLILWGMFGLGLIRFTHQRRPHWVVFFVCPTYHRFITPNSVAVLMRLLGIDPSADCNAHPLKPMTLLTFPLVILCISQESWWHSSCSWCCEPCLVRSCSHPL